MKIIVSLLLAITLLSGCQPHEIFVSPDGDDSADGTIKHPYATIAKAISNMRAGTTVYLRGGTYRPRTDDVMGTALHDLYACVYKLEISGTPDKPLTISGYQDEKVYIDLSDVRPEGKRVSGFYITGDYWHLSKFDIVGIQVILTGHTQSENISLNGGSHCVVDRVNMHDGMGIGVYVKDGHDNLIVNCDAYNNYDYFSKDGAGGNNDGFGFHLPNAQCTGNVIRGCRAWRNSDDGFDLINSWAAVTIDSCWAWQNGYDAEFNRRADGAGFKAGGYGLRKNVHITDVPRNTISNCIAWGNKNNGFYSNHHLGGNNWENNRAYDNGCNFNMVNQKSPEENVDVGGYDHKLVGNISYRGRRGDYSMVDPIRCQYSNNTFLPDVVLTDSDFVSLDPNTLRAPRKADGSLPDVTFMQMRD